MTHLSGLDPVFRVLSQERESISPGAALAKNSPLCTIAPKSKSRSHTLVAKSLDEVFLELSQAASSASELKLSLVPWPVPRYGLLCMMTWNVLFCFFVLGLVFRQGLSRQPRLASNIKSSCAHWVLGFHSYAAVPDSYRVSLPVCLLLSKSHERHISIACGARSHPTWYILPALCFKKTNLVSPSFAFPSWLTKVRTSTVWIRNKKNPAGNTTTLAFQLHRRIKGIKATRHWHQKINK